MEALKPQTASEITSKSDGPGVGTELDGAVPQERPRDTFVIQISNKRKATFVIQISNKRKASFHHDFSRSLVTQN